ncbi:MAG: hypothetical protein F6K50_50135 [Moorea sp. SIO3I7]|uniref:hypothetical protein n=1 Tax=Moorena bouillonii TaxID=207920 RepID=UPI0013012FC7|nr:hypothetical protein [Moorena bouillonii]NEO03191.1 hypothetical protein [Moorena sp. SIO3I7]NEO63027.1 hypothetical protein [Moorena sp. SIO4G2]
MPIASMPTPSLPEIAIIINVSIQLSAISQKRCSHATGTVYAHSQCYTEQLLNKISTSSSVSEQLTADG